MRSVIFLALFCAVLPACFFRPFFGILLWTVISYLNPHRYTFGFTADMPVGYLTAIPTMAGLFFTGQRRLPFLTRETLLLVLLWFWFAVTTANVYYSSLLVHHLSDTLFRFGQISRELIMVFVAMMLIIDKGRLRWWYLVTAGCFAFLALKAVRFGMATGGEFRVYGPPGTGLEDNNGFGLALNMSLPMFLCLAKIETVRAARVALRLAFFAALFAIVLTYSRGGLIGLICVLLAIAFQSRYRMRSLMGVAVLGAILLAAVPEQWISRMQSIKTAHNTDASAKERLNSWDFASHLAMEFYILGGGLETFTTPLYKRYGLEVKGTQYGPHSIYFQMLAEHGFPGLLLFLLIIGSCLVSAHQVKRYFGRADPNHWLVAFADMISASLFAYSVSGAFLGFAYFDLFYQIVATTIVMKFLARKEMLEQERAVPEEIPVAVPAQVSG